MLESGHMDPDLKDLKRELAAVHALARDNHRMLRTVRRHQLLEMFWKLIIWVIIIVASFYSYQTYLQPIVEKYLGTTATISHFLNSINPTQLQNLINSHQTTQ